MIRPTASRMYDFFARVVHNHYVGCFAAEVHGHGPSDAPVTPVMSATLSLSLSAPTY